MPLKTLIQMASGVRSYVGGAKLSDYIPDWILRLTLDAFPNAIAGDSADDQVEGTVIMMGWGIVWSLLGPWMTAGWIILWSPFLFIGIYRYSDSGQRNWNRTAGKLPGVGSNGNYSTRGRK